MLILTRPFLFTASTKPNIFTLGPIIWRNTRIYTAQIPVLCNAHQHHTRPFPPDPIRPPAVIYTATQLKGDVILPDGYHNFKYNQTVPAQLISQLQFISDSQAENAHFCDLFPEEFFPLLWLLFPSNLKLGAWIEKYVLCSLFMKKYHSCLYPLYTPKIKKCFKN